MDTRVPGSRRRIVAMIGLIGVALAATWLWLIGGLSVSGVFENQQADNIVRGKWFEATGAVAALGALAGFVGLATRVRVVVAMGATAVVVAIGALLAAWSTVGWSLGRYDGVLLAALLAAIGVGWLAYRAAYPRTPEAPNDAGG